MGSTYVCHVLVHIIYICILDVDECEVTCDKTLQICNNTYGSYECSCVVGFALVDDECVDFDECALSLSPCQHICTNSLGFTNFSFYLCSFRALGSFDP